MVFVNSFFIYFLNILRLSHAEKKYHQVSFHGHDLGNKVNLSQKVIFSVDNEKLRRVSPFSRGEIFTRARVPLALLSLRKNWY